ncbi:hypothetical protein [uncultured Ferrovibrio sp.]|jgi:anti-sigma factor RsiW|uniref:hypothetical protein n=1 Tax=uncultured Ferrovibrio sp. TaxID=1576913 RepID=UPI00260A8773|nr:hypothetical protein [uncultured Ferrovibrio sp.]
MNLDRFAILIEAYGTDPRRWPADERAAAQALLAASTEAQRLLREAEALDALLSSPLPAIEPSAALRARIMAQIAPSAPAVPGWRMQIAEAFALLFPSGRMVPQFATLGLALAIGIGAGVANIGDDDSDLLTLQLAVATPIYIEE